MAISKVYNEDNMQTMGRFPDKYFDLAIVDPPYGIGIGRNPFRQRHTKKNWDDSAPSDEYFKELFRVSVHQIIFGGNYFPILWQKPCKGFIVWNKDIKHSNRSFGELAWTSYEDKLPKYFEYAWDGNRYGFKGKNGGIGKATSRIHPTEKPTALYEWILLHYAKDNFKILDTHMGSQSLRVATHKLGLDFWGCEADSEYFELGNSRFSFDKKLLNQTLFNNAE